MKPYACILALLVGMNASAEGEWWANINLRSRHFDANRTYNEVNTGFGIEYVHDPAISWNAGEYRNSDYFQSRYLHFCYTPFDWSSLRAGIMIGVLDGYPHIKNGDFFLMSAFSVKTEWKSIGANLYIVPACTECETPSTIALQLRLRFR